MSSAIAIGAHPDDIEFVMAGTLLLLRQRGWEIHYFNLSTGSCGSVRHSAAKLRRMRLNEARRAAKLLRAHFHAPIRTFPDAVGSGGRRRLRGALHSRDVGRSSRPLGPCGCLARRASARCACNIDDVNQTVCSDAELQRTREEI